jgi:hypothetical protein
MSDQSILASTEAFLRLGSNAVLGDSFLRSIHCPYFFVHGHRFRFDYTEVTPLDRIELQACLPRLLTSMRGKTLIRPGSCSLLAGIGQYDCLATCLSEDEYAYALASSLIFYIDDFMEDGRERTIALPYVLSLLNQWLKPLEPWVKLPGVVTVCRQLFGSPWCELFLPDNCLDEVGGFRLRGVATLDGYQQYTVNEFVEIHPAPFMPGLCKTQTNSDPVVLPELFTND